MSAHLDKAKPSPSPTPSPAPSATNPDAPRPYLRADGTLVIPMLSDPKYHWWKPGGQNVAKTMEELRAQAG